MAGSVKASTLSLARNLGSAGGGSGMFLQALASKGNFSSKDSLALAALKSFKRPASTSVCWTTGSPRFCLLSAAATASKAVNLRSKSGGSGATLVKAMTSAARPLVICGPSGVGKSTLITRLTEAFPESFGFSVSHTTRRPREGELDGVNYHYVKRRDFEAAKDRGEFIETAEFSGNLYGTSRGAVNSVQMAGKICILDIDMQGVIQLKNIPEMNPLYVFIRPPSMDMLEKRLRNRSTDPEEAVQRRLEIARKEMEYGSEPKNFDLVVVNDHLDEASKNLIDYMRVPAEELRRIKEELASNK